MPPAAKAATKKPARKAGAQACRARARSLARVEPGRPLPGDRRAGVEARSRARRRRIVAFEEAYKGKLAALAAAPDARREARRRRCKRYEALDDLLGRLISFASLVYAGNTDRSGARQILRRHAGAITRASLHLLFFTLELNRIDDAALEAAMARSGARPLPAVDRGHPQGEAVSARGSRRGAVPREVGDRRGRLEPAVRRDASRALRFKVDGKPLAIEATLSADAGRRRQEAPRRVRSARQDLQGRTCAPSR